MLLLPRQLQFILCSVGFRIGVAAGWACWQECQHFTSVVMIVGRRYDILSGNISDTTT